MLLPLAALAVWSYLYAYDRQVWWTEMSTVAAAAAVVAIMAPAILREPVEWMYAEWEGGTAGAAFLGSQGDVWDAQKDMLMDTLGALLWSVLFLICSPRPQQTCHALDLCMEGQRG